MNIPEILIPTGLVEIVHKNSKGRILNVIKVPNLITTAGKTHIAAKIAATTNSPASVTHMATGTGTAAAVVGDTTLATEAARVALTATSASTNTLTYTATFGAGVGTGALTEAGILNASSGGTLLCRTVFSVVNKAAGDSIAITWVVTVS